MSTEMARTVGAPVVRTVDGTRYVFPALKRRHIGRLLAVWAEEDRSRLMKILDDAKATSEERVARLEKHDQSARLISFGYRSLFEFERVGEVLLTSKRIEEPDTDDAWIDSIPFTQDQMNEIACELWGFDIPTSDDTEGEDDGNPTA